MVVASYRGAMRTITVEERRARLGVRHLLAERARTVEEVAGALVGLHASDPVSVYLSARARLQAFAREDLDTALYDRRSLVRMLGMRRTMFVVPRDLAAIMDAACTKALAPAQRRRLIGMLEDQGVTPDGAVWLRRVCTATMQALRERGEATATQLVDAVPELGLKLMFGEGKTWGGQVGVSTRVLFLLATVGRIVRGRPRGSWVSSQYRWTPTDTWLGASLPTVPHAEASAALLERWLRSFGPATITDIRWWTGWTQRQTSMALGEIDTEVVTLEDGARAHVLADDVDPVPAPAQWVALLPSLDATTMGWKQRGWYLGEHASALFDRNGNAGPTVWADGRVIGGWGQSRDGSIAVALLERVDAVTAAGVRTEQPLLADWLG